MATTPVLNRPERATAGYSQSLERGLAILSSFTSDSSVLGISEVARIVGLSRSTAHRYVATLARLGYLQQDPATKRYRLGPRVLDLGFAAIHSMDLREIAMPYLQRLSDETGFTVNMAVLDGHEVVYIERCRTSRPGQRDIDLNLHVGSRLPAYCTALGKALLAFLPEDELERGARRRGADAARAERDHDAGQAPGGARARARHRARPQQRGARVRAPLARRADPVAVRLGRGGDQPRCAPIDGLDGGARPALRPTGAPDG